MSLRSLKKLSYLKNYFRGKIFTSHTFTFGKKIPGLYLGSRSPTRPKSNET
jgi:hypothetical protein